MGARENLQKLYDKKQSELKNLETAASDLRIYLQAIQDSIKALPKEMGSSRKDQFELRPNTTVAKTRDILRTRGEPMHIVEILKALGNSTDKKHRVSLGGSLSSYVRNNQIFTRPAPNTFGLVEFGPAERSLSATISPTFGEV